ncbi:MAG: septum site-determining protein MinC [Candidatus Dechloromonas phosphoritropha]
MRQTSTNMQLIEFKGTTLPVVTVTLHSFQLDALALAAGELFGNTPFFDGDAAVLDLSQLVEFTEVDWQGVQTVLKTHGLNVIGVCGGNSELRHRAAADAGLPTYAALERSVRAAPATEVATPPPVPATEPPVAAAPPTAAIATVASPTLFIDRPLRSGQQIYARGGDLVVLAAVNAGAEVIADGSIHIYAPLRGRALAGAGGAENARILCTRFEAELVSIAGLYRTFDTGVPVELAGKPVQVLLNTSPSESTGRLIIEPLTTD